MLAEFERQHSIGKERMEVVHVNEAWKAIQNCKNPEAPGKDGLQNVLLIISKKGLILMTKISQANGRPVWLYRQENQGNQTYQLVVDQ